jgi:hypothetical protein
MKQAMDSGAWLENRAANSPERVSSFSSRLGSGLPDLRHALQRRQRNEPIPAGKSIAMSFSGFETEDQMQRRIYEVMRKLPVLPKE